MMVAMLIFAPQAIDASVIFEAARINRLGSEDYARKMYPQYTRLDLPTWIIGPALGRRLLMDRPSDIHKIWPTRAPIHRQRRAEFN